MRGFVVQILEMNNRQRSDAGRGGDVSVSGGGVAAGRDISGSTITQQTTTTENPPAASPAPPAAAPPRSGRR